MDKKIFYDNVVAMRIAQKKYIETGDDVWLELSLKYETIIDNEIERVQSILEKLNNEKK